MRAHVLFAIATATSIEASTTQGACGSGFQVCTASGSSASTPQINDPAFQNLFVDIVESSLPSSSKRSAPSRLFERASTSLCCNELLSCLTMSNLGIPFCYDRFTTNFHLPDGSSGTVVNGSYQSSGGDIANLETGDFTLANGTNGNIYADNPAAKPNTSTLPIPTQFTAAGVGSAVPISSVGIEVTLTYTTTISASTLPPKTISASTISGAISTETEIVPATTTLVSGTSFATVIFAATSFSSITLPASVVAGTTISGSTVSPVVTVITTTKISPSSTAKKNGVERGLDFTLVKRGLCHVISFAVPILSWMF